MTTTVVFSRPSLAQQVDEAIYCIEFACRSLTDSLPSAVAYAVDENGARKLVLLVAPMEGRDEPGPSGYQEYAYPLPEESPGLLSAIALLGRTDDVRTVAQQKGVRYGGGFVFTIPID